jgi:putative ABC transport system substrate-binding protein
MRRRAFVAGIAGSAFAWPLAARAQQPVKPVVAFLSGVQVPVHLVEAFRRGLSEIGYIEGQNVAFEYRTPVGNTTDFAQSLTIWFVNKWQ